MKRPFLLWLLVLALIFLGLGGLYGGINMLADPTGGLMNMEAVLPQLGVPNYILPGLFLFFVMGLFPLFLCYALITRPTWLRIERLLPWRTYHWAWVSTIALSIVLFIWLSVQGILIGFVWPIQFVTLSNGIIILLIALLPPLSRYYKK